MPQADVVVVGAGLAGLTAAARLAGAGASVHLVAKGHGTTHWAAGGMDVAVVPGASTPARAVAALAHVPGHPYAYLASDTRPAIEWLLATLAGQGLPYAGGLDEPIRLVPTAIGGTRPAAIVPDGQAAALRPWAPDEPLVICGPSGFKDFWPAAIALSLARPAVWAGTDNRPVACEALTVDLPGLAGRHNLDALELARRFDDPAWRGPALDAIARALEARGARRGSPGRVGLPAVLGLHDHPAVLEEARRRLPLEPFEIPLVPPSVPGVRLHDAFRSVIRRAGGRIQIGQRVARIEREGNRVLAVHLEAAVRTFPIRTGALILATGSIAGGGLVGTLAGTLEEPVLGLPVEAPGIEDWLAQDGLDPAGHPLEAAGIRTDARLRPIDPASGAPVLANVVVAGALLAGQRALRERCGDGVAVTSGWRAAGELIGLPLARAGASRAVR